MGLPCDRDRGIRLRLTAAALIVEKQIVRLAEVQHLWEQIAVVCARPSVQNEELWSIGAPVFHPVERRAGGRRESLFARRGDRLGHLLYVRRHHADADWRFRFSHAGSTRSIIAL